MFNESRGGRAARVVRPRHLPPAPEGRLVVIVAKYNRLLLIEAELVRLRRGNADATG